MLTMQLLAPATSVADAITKLDILARPAFMPSCLDGRLGGVAAMVFARPVLFCGRLHIAQAEGQRERRETAAVFVALFTRSTVGAVQFAMG